MTNKTVAELVSVRTAMILAAGRGTRLAALTATTPKPLLRVGGRALIDHAIDQVTAAGIERIVVNVHHHAELIEEHLSSRADVEILISQEQDALLDTGGGVVKALPLIADETALILNSDLVWPGAPGAAAKTLLSTWRPDVADAHLLVRPTLRVRAYRGVGDFMMGPDGALERRREGHVTPYIFTGMQILKCSLFAGLAVEPFSLNRIYDWAQESGRLFGVRYEGNWIDAGTPGSLAHARDLMDEVAQGRIL